jgi:alpha-beta hydrolase superfamily lysophospholipase
MARTVAPRAHRISTADGTALHVTDYLLPMAEASGSVVLMHGLGEHSGRYRHVAAFFNECGLSVRCYDHRGHGRSEGPRGDVINGNPMVQDAEIVIDDFASRFDLPPFLFGHSMGGLFAARFALSRLSPLRGLILSSPALAVRLSGLQMMLLRMMEKIAPAFGAPNSLPVAYLSHDPAVVAAYQADPLVHGKISARLMRSMLDSMTFCDAKASTLAVPTLLMFAGDDHLVDADGSRRFLAQLPEGMARSHLYEAFYHEIFNETESAQPFSDLRTWLIEQGVMRQQA